MKNKLETIQTAIDIWSIRLSDVQDELNICNDVLTASEQERAGRLIKQADANRFILCRGLRRRILADYLGENPADLFFEENGNGKPFLADHELTFNVSHSRDRFVVAVTAGRAVGVDIEFRRGDVQMSDIAQRWFSPAEQSFFQCSEHPGNAFFDIWAKKEAYVKAQGKGIFHELNSFSVPLESVPGVPGIGKNPGWFFQTLEIDPRYAAALVSEAPAVPVQFRNFSTHE